MVFFYMCAFLNLCICVNINFCSYIVVFRHISIFVYLYIEVVISPSFPVSMCGLPHIWNTLSPWVEQGQVGRRVFPPVNKEIILD